MSFDQQTLLLTAASATAILATGFGLLQNLFYLAQLVLAAYALTSTPPVDRMRILWRRYSDVTPPVAVIAPAYNEENSVVDNVRSLLALHYPNFEVILVNDGSTDGTLATLIRAFELVPIERSYDRSVRHEDLRGLYGSARHRRLLVVDKHNGGKADALNAGINLARAPLFCSIDADSLLEPDALLRAVRPFIEDPERMVAVGGTIRIANGCRTSSGRVTAVGVPHNLLALFQVVEYIRAFLMARLAWSRIGSLTLISGAFGMFRRQYAVAVGGYSHGTVGEDLELVVKLHRHMRDRGLAYRIEFVPEPVCWTEVPETWRMLARQRTRWHRGALETFFKHRDMLFSRRYGRIGFVSFGHMLVVDVAGPVIEVAGYVLVPLLWMAQLVSLSHLMAFTAVTFIFGVFISVCSLILEELELKRFPLARHLLILTLIAVLENFGYRQINNVWRVLAFWQYLRGNSEWGAMTRVGFSRE